LLLPLSLVRLALSVVAIEVRLIREKNVFGVNIEEILGTIVSFLDMRRCHCWYSRHLLPKIDIDRHIFMQDGAPAHTAKITKEFLANSNVKLMEWPAKSPDLNPIETVWGMMKARIRVDAFATAETLQKEVMKAWDSISQDQINELVLGFKNRVNKMVERKGKATNVARCYQSP